MKTFKVRFGLTHESFKGYDLTEHQDYEIEALHIQSAINKAIKLAPKYGWISSIDVYQGAKDLVYYAAHITLPLWGKRPTFKIKRPAKKKR